ncbi:MAG: hypothetical protein HY858_11210 [Candidatus Solibacter usitatus]|nr:hypothetical protein [Candidatus Solibacter usitatus]
MTHTGSIPQLILRARRRAVVQLVLEHLGWGAAAGLAAFLVLLLVGTQILDWYWPVLILALASAIAWWRSRGRIPRDYDVAQRLDRALDAHDVLSTAFHYLHGSPARPPEPAFLSRLAGQAESAAMAADPVSALPFRAPRSAWPALAMLAASAVMFTVRYGVLRTFDLSAPLAEVRFDTLAGTPQPVKQGPKQLAQKGGYDPFSLTVPDSERTELIEKQNAFEESLRTIDVKDPSQSGRQGQKGDRSKAENEDSGDNTEEIEAPDSGDKQASSGAKDGRRPGDQPPNGKKGPQDKNSLMDKMRDALANLMDKLGVEPKGSESQKSASNKSGQKGEKGQPQPGKPNQPGEPDPTQAGQQPGDAENAQQAQNSPGGDKQDEPSNNEKSGIGRQDGRKDTELAEQKDAMGKLSELLGKRALNVQGEVMVEVTNSKNQQLKTPYVNRSAAHSDSGGELSRDEVPLHLQDFVQRYYQQVRKPAAAPAAAPKQ